MKNIFLIGLGFLFLASQSFAYSVEPASNHVLQSKKYTIPLPGPGTIPQQVFLGPGTTVGKSPDKDPVFLHHKPPRVVTNDGSIVLVKENGSSLSEGSRGSFLSSSELRVVLSSTRRYDSFKRKWMDWKIEGNYRENVITSWLKHIDRIGMNPVGVDYLFYSKKS